VRRRRPPVELLSPDQRRGRADGYEQHVLHVEPDGSFSIVGLVWRPGQSTPIHDHVSWCVVAVLAGVEHEVIYEARKDGRQVVALETATNPAGTVCGIAPPGDIHRVWNGGDEIAISLHVYGADIGELGSSIRRCYPT
jgi:3-mercaptopropionate dioxygenase